jgi:hypothetical protein
MQPCIPHALSAQMDWNGIVKTAVPDGQATLGQVPSI